MLCDMCILQLREGTVELNRLTTTTASTAPKWGVLTSQEAVVESISCLQNELDLIGVWRIKNPELRVSHGVRNPPCICCAMLSYVVLCCALLCYVGPCRAIHVCQAMLCYVWLCWAMFHYVVPCCAMLCYVAVFCDIIIIIITLLKCLMYLALLC